jgi:hypothetical protein
MLVQSTVRTLFLICALALLNACVNSPLGANAQVKLYTWDNRVVAFYDTQTYEDETFGGLLNGGIALGGIMDLRPQLDIRSDTPYLLEVCNDEELCYYLVLFPGDFRLSANGVVAGYAAVTEVSTAIYYQVKDLDAVYVRAAVDEIAANVIGDDISNDDKVNYSDIIRLDHFNKKARENQLRDPLIVDELHDDLAQGDDRTISEVFPIFLEDGTIPLQLFDPACFETPDDGACVPPEPDDLCRIDPDNPECGRIPADHCLLFPDQRHCKDLAETEFCLDSPDAIYCRGLRLDDLCSDDPEHPVCHRERDPVHCERFPDNPFCGGFPTPEECREDPLDPLCGRGYFDRFCATEFGEELCEKPPVDEVCRINADSEFCFRPGDHPMCQRDPGAPGCSSLPGDDDFCLDQPGEHMCGGPGDGTDDDEPEDDICFSLESECDDARDEPGDPPPEPLE